jgi:hypothetical protein
MLHSFLIGLTAFSSAFIRGSITSRFSMSQKTLSIIRAVRATASISAVVNELNYESAKIRKGTNLPVFGFFSVPRFAVSVLVVKLRYYH